MALTTMDGYTAALAGAKTTWQSLKTGLTPQAVGSWTSLWLSAGNAGVAPSSGVAGDIPTDATAGAFPFTNPGGAALSYLSQWAMYSSQVGTLYLYDRLWHNSGLSVTSTAGQTVQASTPLVPLTRPDATGAQVEAWWEIYTVMGAGTPTITITYTDQDGNLGATGTLRGFAATASASRTFPFSLASGDTGVRSIQTYTSSATMLTGAMGLVQRRLIAQAHFGAANTGVNLDGIALGLPRVYDDACLEFVWLANAASGPTHQGMFAIAQG